MADRLQLKTFANAEDLEQLIREQLKELTKFGAFRSGMNHLPMLNCIQTLVEAKATAMVVQTRVPDPDFLAEFGAYYSRQFADVPRFCTRLHFLHMRQLLTKTCLLIWTEYLKQAIWDSLPYGQSLKVQLGLLFWLRILRTDSFVAWTLFLCILPA